MSVYFVPLLALLGSGSVWKLGLSMEGRFLRISRITVARWYTTVLPPGINEIHSTVNTYQPARHVHLSNLHRIAEIIICTGSIFEINSCEYTNIVRVVLYGCPM